MLPCNSANCLRKQQTMFWNQTMAGNTCQTANRSFAVMQDGFVHSHIIIPANTENPTCLSTLPHSAGRV